MRIAISILLVFVASSGQTFCQEASELSAESKGVLSILSEVQEADKDELHILAVKLKAFPAGTVDQALRIKAGGMVADRFLKLELPKSAMQEFSYALSLPHANVESSLGCANMWGVAMDTLLFHLNHTAQHEKILATLEQYATHSNSVCFKATFYDLKRKWLLYTGDAEASDAFGKKAVTTLLESLPNGPAEYELYPLFELVRGVDSRHDELRKASLERLAKYAESYIRDSGGSLRPFHAFVACRETLCKDAIARYEENVDVSQYGDGVEGLAQIAIVNTKGENSRAVQDRVKLILSLFKQGQEKRKDKLVAPKIVGKQVPALLGEWITRAEAADLSGMRGKVVVLDFWAVWCGPCIASFPKMQSLQDDFTARGLIVVGVTNWNGYTWDAEKKRPVRDDADVKQEVLDSGNHSLEVAALRNFIQKHKVTYPQLAVTKDSDAWFNVDALPTIIVIDKQGIVRRVFTGASDRTHAALRRTVESLLSD